MFTLRACFDFIKYHGYQFHLEHHAMKSYGGVEVKFQAFLVLHYMEESGLLHTLSTLPPEKKHSTHRIGV
jgi:hypothetical protein